MTIEQPYWNHNSGNLLFGPDGYLYIAFGDGGKRDDPLKLAQNPWVLNGKIIRIGHMGHVDAADTLAAIGALELALHAQGFDLALGTGLTAAQKVFAEML